MSRRVKTMKAWRPFLVLLLFGIQEGSAQTGEDPAERDDATVVAFVNVAVVSIQNETLLEEQTVIVQGDRILSIGRVGAISVPGEATVIDGSGRYLIPGLADMHVHVHAPFADGPLYLNAGITTVLRAYPTTVSDCIILATAGDGRLSEEVQGWTKTE